MLAKKFWEGLLVKRGRNAKPALCSKQRVLKVHTCRAIGRKSHADLSDAIMRMVASREAMHSALLNAIACGDDGEVIELLGTEAEFPPDPRFAFRCTTVPYLTTLSVSLLRTYEMTLIDLLCIINGVVLACMVPSIHWSCCCDPFMAH